jgi:hypothetical protein
VRKSKEAVGNALDGCEEAGILPDIRVEAFDDGDNIDGHRGANGRTARDSEFKTFLQKSKQSWKPVTACPHRGADPVGVRGQPL